MDRTEYQLVIDKIKKILQNVPLNEGDVVPTSEEVDRVQQALVYLSQCFVEIDNFAGTLCRGELDATQPSRHNYLAGGLKELHAVLRHLTWQTKQIANGDYQQRVNFLGDFSVSFNKMIQQLDERERKLKESATALEQSVKLITSIMDHHRDWIMVTNKENNKVLYSNKSTKIRLEYFHARELGLKEIPRETRDGTIAPHDATLYYDEKNGNYYSVMEYPMFWENQEVVVHYVADITQEQNTQKTLSDMAYSDQVTGLYNRHFCMMEIQRLLEEKVNFSLVLVDVNELKYVNDNLGHEEGDFYLKFVARIMKEYTRGDDCICRIGGDEFIILLRNCEEQSAQKKMGEILQAIYAGCGKSYRTSISYGITYVDAQQEHVIKELVEESDRKMYQFKQAFKKSEGIQR